VSAHSLGQDDRLATPYRPAGAPKFAFNAIRAGHADGETVIVLWAAAASPPSAPYETRYAWITRMRAGKVIDGTALCDSVSFNDLWPRVQPR